MAQTDYERARANLEALIDWAAANDAAGSRNEATTRLHLIDQLLFMCLGWSLEDGVAEDSHNGTFTDYSLGRPYRRLVVEAKKEGIYFELPAGFSRLVCPLSVVTEGNPQIRDAIQQASDYCQERGIAIAVVTNGFQLIAFLGSRLDGIPPLQGNALVFATHQQMRQDFRRLWDNLSPPGIDEHNVYSTLAASNMPAPPDKLSRHLPSYPGFKTRNQVQLDLQILGELFLEDVARNPETEEEFLRECYCASGLLSQYALISKEILRTRYSMLLEAEAEVQTRPVTDKTGLSSELVSDIRTASISRRPIILLGDVGVGKTIFLRHLIRVDARDVLDQAIVLYVDFGSRPTLEDHINTFVMSEFARQLLEVYDIDIEEDAFVRGVYHGELLRFEGSIYGRLRQVDEAAYQREQINFLADKVRDRSNHLQACLKHIVQAWRKQIVIVLDNVDQREFEFQERTFLIANSLAATWPGTVFISLRPETFYRSKTEGAISAYQPRVFTVSPPRVDLVINRRFAFAKRQLTESGRLDTFPSGLTVHSQTLTKYLELLMDSFESRGDLIEALDNLSGGNVRTALEFIQAFVASPHVASHRILSEYLERGRHIRLHEFMRAIIYGNTEYYDPIASPLVNMFDISLPDGQEHFLLAILLASVAKRGEAAGSQGFVELSQVNHFLQGLGFQPTQIRYALDRARAKRLVEMSPRFGQDVGESKIRITTVGGYCLHRLMGQYVYINAVVVDTPFVIDTWRESIRDESTMMDRLKRAEYARAYLDRQWRPLAQKQVGFDWPAISKVLRDEVAGIARSVDGGN